MNRKLVNFADSFLKSEQGVHKIAVVQFTCLNDSFNWGTKHCEHRFNPIFVDELEMCIQKLEADRSYRCLVLTGEGKYFSNGMDIDFIRCNLSQAHALQKRTESLMSRILKLPLITVSLINGHCTAAGAVLSLCTDYRLMISRGLFFLPAVNLGIVYSQGLIEVVKAKVSDPIILQDMLLFSRRYSSTELVKLGIVHRQIETVEEGLNEIENLYREHSNFVGSSLGAVRSRMYQRAIQCLESDDVDSNMFWENLNKCKL
jgi:enoyl-CoA hydratase/carnithine racemase